MFRKFKKKKHLKFYSNCTEKKNLKLKKNHENHTCNKIVGPNYQITPSKNLLSWKPRSRVRCDQRWHPCWSTCSTRKVFLSENVRELSRKHTHTHTRARSCAGCELWLPQGWIISGVWRRQISAASFRAVRVGCEGREKERSASKHRLILCACVWGLMWNLVWWPTTARDLVYKWVVV